jgi:hypothetical protein
MMEVPMRDLLLQAAGVIAILVTIGHAVLGETQVFARATIEMSAVVALAVAGY